jgi:hypothetical protein
VNLRIGVQRGIEEGGGWVGETWWEVGGWVGGRETMAWPAVSVDYIHGCDVISRDT